jgi:hypothetical protein
VLVNRADAPAQHHVFTAIEETRVLGAGDIGLVALPSKIVLFCHVPLHPSHRWVHATQHGSPDKDTCPVKNHLKYSHDLTFKKCQMSHKGKVGTYEGTSEHMKERCLVSRIWLRHSICNYRSVLRKKGCWLSCKCLSSEQMHLLSTTFLLPKTKRLYYGLVT